VNNMMRKVYLIENIPHKVHFVRWPISFITSFHLDECNFLIMMLEQLLFWRNTLYKQLSN
jgi:hypothetical protein